MWDWLKRVFALECVWILSCPLLSRLQDRMLVCVVAGHLVIASLDSGTKDSRFTLPFLHLPSSLLLSFFYSALPFCCVCWRPPPPFWLPLLFFLGFPSHCFTLSSQLPLCVTHTHRLTHTHCLVFSVRQAQSGCRELCSLGTGGRVIVGYGTVACTKWRQWRGQQDQEE